jgi:peptidoglycan-associated lipoprotein
MRALISLTVPFIIAIASGCSHDEPEVKAPVATTATPQTTAAVAPKGKDPAVNVSDEIMKACSIKVVESVPKFDFDSSNLSSAERDILGQVAKCLTTGPLAGRNVKLTGRADPRGEQEYNMNLGEHRATSVRKYLVGLGVGDGRMSETSRGALDATGKDEQGWQNDRRVDVSLN